MIDIVKALRSRATWETAIGFTEPHQHINWMAAEEITRLREENARLREALEEALPFVRIKGMWSEEIHDRIAAAILGKVKAEAACPAPDEAP